MTSPRWTFSKRGRNSFYAWLALQHVRARDRFLEHESTLSSHIKQTYLHAYKADWGDARNEDADKFNHFSVEPIPCSEDFL